MGKDIYSLKLHESIVDGPYIIKRVPGGWIYAMSLSGNVDGVVFVPFNKEFKESTKQTEIPEMKFNFKKSLIDLGVTEQVASDWLKVRSKKKASNTETAFNRIKKQILLTTQPADICIKKAVEKDWKGFESDWYFKETKKTAQKTGTKNVNDKWTESDI